MYFYFISIAVGS